MNTGAPWPGTGSPTTWGAARPGTGVNSSGSFRKRSMAGTPSPDPGPDPRRRDRAFRGLVERAGRFDWHDGHCQEFQEGIAELTGWSGFLIHGPPDPPFGPERDEAIRRWNHLYDLAEEPAGPATLPPTDTPWCLPEPGAREVAYLWIPCRRREAHLMVVWKKGPLAKGEKER